MHFSQRIDYTNFLLGRSRETDPAKIAAMRDAAVRALTEDKGIDPETVSCECYADGRVKVSVCGKYYNIFDTNTGKFFSGYVGDGPSQA